MSHGEAAPRLAHFSPSLSELWSLRKEAPISQTATNTVYGLCGDKTYMSEKKNR